MPLNVYAERMFTRTESVRSLVRLRPIFQSWQEAAELAFLYMWNPSFSFLVATFKGTGMNRTTTSLIERHRFKKSY